MSDVTPATKAGAAVTVAEDFAVEPADALCTAAPTGTVTAPDPARPHHRQLTADIDIGTTAAVTVSCTADRRADSTRDVVLSGVAADCDSPLGSVVHGVTVRDGIIASRQAATRSRRPPPPTALWARTGCASRATSPCAPPTSPPVPSRPWASRPPAPGPISPQQRR